MDFKPHCFIMTGAPGSGKSTLAKQFAETFNCIICSADDFFMKDGVYKWYNAAGANHKYCQKLFDECISSRENVIIDNTNVKPSDYKYYVDIAKENKYEIFFVEPPTAWALDAKECFNRNTHNVPFVTIQKMISSLIETKHKFPSRKVIQSVEQVYGD